MIGSWRPFMPLAPSFFLVVLAAFAPVLDVPGICIRHATAVKSRAAPGPCRGMLSRVTIARHNIGMELAPRLHLMNWLVSQGLTGLPENDLIRGFCERCRASGLDISRATVFIDTLHPIFEGRGFRWNDTESDESDTFEYGPTGEGDAAQNWRRSVFHHMLENGHDDLHIDLADCASLDFSLIGDLAARGHRHLVAFVHRF